MTEVGAVSSRESRLVRGVAVALVAAAVLRLLVAVIAGFVDLGSGRAVFPTSRDRTGDVLLTFGFAGDLAGALLAVGAAGLVWWLVRRGEPSRGLSVAVRWVLVLTAASASAQAISYLLLFDYSSAPAAFYARLILSVGFAVAVVVVAAGVLVAMQGIGSGELSAIDDADEVFVFAVDRRDGSVHAYLSLDEAARKTHVYFVEDGELDFFTDEGDVIEASIEHGRVRLRPSEVNRRDVLLNAVQEFAARKEIRVDERVADDPTSYAGPINTWQWLQLWPPWMRWIGRLVGPR